MISTLRDLFQRFFSPKPAIPNKCKRLEYYDFVARVCVVDIHELRRASLRNRSDLRPDPRGLQTEVERWIDTVLTPKSVPGCAIVGSTALHCRFDAYDYELRLRVEDANALRAAVMAHPDFHDQVMDRDGGGVSIITCLNVLLSRWDVPGCTVDCQEAYFDVGVAGA
jgi:hypothetical protein